MDPEEKLDETIRETFPASDAPGNTPETGIRVRIDTAVEGPRAVRDNAIARRFELEIEGQVAYLEYQREPGEIVLVHTEVPAALRGRGLAVRGATPSAFERRCIPAGCVAPPLNIPDILGRRALPAGRLAALGATMELHHGLLGNVLAQHALDAARAEGLAVAVICPFVRAYLGKHPQA